MHAAREHCAPRIRRLLLSTLITAPVPLPYTACYASGDGTAHFACESWTTTTRLMPIAESDSSRTRFGKAKPSQALAYEQPLERKTRAGDGCRKGGMASLSPVKSLWACGAPTEKRRRTTGSKIRLLMICTRACLGELGQDRIRVQRASAASETGGERNTLTAPNSTINMYR